VLLAVLTVGGCGDSQRYGIPTSALESDQRVDERIRVDVERSGGFADIVIRRSADTGSLPDDEAQQLADLVADLNVDAVRSAATPSPLVRDAFEYDVKIMRGTEQIDLHAQDPNVPPQLRLLISFVFRHR